jgi:hypothetical protein
MRVAAEFARAFGLGLHGVFVEDESLLHLAALPFAREIRLPSHTWRAFEPTQLQAELRHAAEAAQHRLLRAVAALGLPVEFEVLRGQPHICIAGVCTPTDIVVMPAEERADERGMALLRALGETAASILLAPNHPLRRIGPAAVVAAGMDDADLALAAQIAQGNDRPGDSRLVTIVVPAASKAPLQLATDIGIAPDRLILRAIAGSRPNDVLRVLAGARERIVVITKSAMTGWESGDAARIARALGIPVLIL